MATHCSILAWRIPWSEEPGGLQSMGSQSWTRLKWLITEHPSISPETLWCSFTCFWNFDKYVLPYTLFCVCYFAQIKWSEVTQSCPALSDPMDCSLPDSSIHGISRQEYWNELSFPSPEDLPDQGIKPGSPALQADALPSEPPGKLSFIFIFLCVFPLCEDFIFYLATLLFMNIPVFHLSDFKMLLWHSCTFLLDIYLGIDMYMSSFIRYGEIFL